MTSRLHQRFYRTGNEHRAGADVSFGDIIKCFGFRSIEVGKWVTKEEQQIGANLFLMRCMTYAIYCKSPNLLFL